MTHTPVSAQDVLASGQETAELGGREVRKGTVAAFVANARALEEMAEDDPGRDAVAAQLRVLLPNVRAVGLFDVFAPRSATLRETLDLD